MGTWVAIGSFWRTSNTSSETALLNCDGIRRGVVFEWVLVVSPDSLLIDAVGIYQQGQRHRHDAQGNLIFSFEDGGDDLRERRCRITPRNTLVCLDGADLPWAEEFTRKEVPASQRVSTHTREPA